MNNSEIKNVLVFRPGSLGDTIVALPALWSLRGQLRSAKITHLYNIDRRNQHYITPRDVLDGSGLVDEWLEYPFFDGQSRASRAISQIRLFLNLRRSRFDALVYLMPRERKQKQIDRDIFFFKATGIRKFFGVDYLRKNRFELFDRPAAMRVDNESTFLMHCLESDGFAPVSPEDFDWLKISEGERSTVNALRANQFTHYTDRTLLAVSPGSKRPSRIWNEDHFLNVIKRLVAEKNVFPIFFGSTAEFELCERMKQTVGTGFNAAGKLCVRKSAALLRICRLYLGNDTGTMHLAAAVGTRCVAIFSAADRDGQWEPFGKGHKFFRQNVECAGCRIDVCPRANLCLELIAPDDVFSSCTETLECEANS
ncbi:MAG: hypothetical protein DMF62_05845 [Acidobacteria bacterium]|nr:MAG: hypothetical protein DMF62_05845 [Acidobacteriota bacterium]